MILQFSEYSKHSFIANTFHFQVSVFQLFNYTESFYKAAYNNLLLFCLPWDLWGSCGVNCGIPATTEAIQKNTEMVSHK